MQSLPLTSTAFEELLKCEVLFSTPPNSRQACIPPPMLKRLHNSAQWSLRSASRVAAQDFRSPEKPFHRPGSAASRTPHNVSRRLMIDWTAINGLTAGDSSTRWLIDPTDYCRYLRPERTLPPEAPPAREPSRVDSLQSPDRLLPPTSDAEWANGTPRLGKSPMEGQSNAQSERAGNEVE
jgi:hypothetical protein